MSIGPKSNHSAVAVFVLASFAALLVPALCATKLDPIIALQAE
jgi:hypothetical protein